MNAWFWFKFWSSCCIQLNLACPRHLGWAELCMLATHSLTRTSSHCTICDSLIRLCNNHRQDSNHWAITWYLLFVQTVIRSFCIFNNFNPHALVPEKKPTSNLVIDHAPSYDPYYGLKLKSSKMFTNKNTSKNPMKSTKINQKKHQWRLTAVRPVHQFNGLNQRAASSW